MSRMYCSTTVIAAFAFVCAAGVISAAFFTDAVAHAADLRTKRAVGPDYYVCCKTRRGFQVVPSKKCRPPLGSVMSKGHCSRPTGRRVCCLLPRSKTATFMIAGLCKSRGGQIVRAVRCTAKPSMTLRRKHGSVSISRFRQILRRSGPAGRSQPRVALRRPKDTAHKPGVSCFQGQYLPCFCTGESACNTFIAACVGADHTVECNEHNDEGQPTGCVCA